MQDAIDITALDLKKGAEAGFGLRLKHPATGKDLDFTITLLGPESDAYQEKLQELVRRGVETMRAEGRKELTFTEKRDQEVELHVAITTAWSRPVKFSDAPAESFSPDAARRAYLQYGWIRRQIDAGLENSANFLPASGTDSSPTGATSSS